MGISRDHRRGEGVALDLVVGTWADPTGSYYEVTCDAGFEGENYSCSVRIQRPNGDVFDRPSVIKQFGDWTIVWGQKYVLDEAISNGHKLQWNNLRGGSGFVWQRVKPEHSKYRGYGSARKGSFVRAAPRATGKATSYDAKTWNNSWFGWQKKDRDGWEKWEPAKSEHADEYEEDEDTETQELHETQATTASDESATEAKGSASDVDERREGQEHVVETVRWRPKLHPPPPPSRQNRSANFGYWNKEVVVSRYSIEAPYHPPRRESHRSGQYIGGCVSYGTSAEFKNVPIYDGVLERFDKEKNSGVISSRGAVADFKQNVYVHGTVLQSSRVSLKDRVCFTVHTNAHGKPQASRPLLRLRANDGYALSGTFTEAAPDSTHIAGTIHCPAVSQLFDSDVQVSHEIGRQLQNGDQVNFNARWIFEDNDGKLEASEVQREQILQPPPGLGVSDPVPAPTEESLDRPAPDQSQEAILKRLAQEEVIHL